MNLSFDDKKRRFDDLSLDLDDKRDDVEDEETKDSENDAEDIISDDEDVDEDQLVEELTDENEVDINEPEIETDDGSVVEEVEPEILDESQNETDSQDENVDDSVEKKTETEIVNEYLKPNNRCILCTTPIWALKLNKAYLDGLSYGKMIDKFSQKFEERTGRSLNKPLLHRHFKSHFDARAAAIAEYNKRRDNVAPGINPSTAQRDIFKLATMKYLDELEMFDATSKEMITKYQELEVLIEEKRASGKSFGIDELILKQAQILNSLNKQAISKFKALSRVDLESKQGQFLTQLGFIGNKAMLGLTGGGTKQQLLSPMQTEEIYLGVVIKQILARLEEPLKSTFGHITQDQKALFYRELKKSMEGIQDGITVDFERQIKSQTKLISDKQQQQSTQQED